MKIVLTILGLAVLAWGVVFLGKFPVHFDLGDVDTVIVHAEIRNPSRTGPSGEVIYDGPVFRSFDFEVHDPKEIAKLEESMGTVWRGIFDLSSHEGYDRIFSVSLVSGSKSKEIIFTETEWFPGGRTPPAVLQWMDRHMANK